MLYLLRLASQELLETPGPQRTVNPIYSILHHINAEPPVVTNHEAENTPDLGIARCLVALGSSAVTRRHGPRSADTPCALED